MVKVEIDAGVCQFITTVKVEDKGGYKYKAEIETDCPHIKDLIPDVTDFDLMVELTSVYGKQIQDAVNKHLRGSCAGCVVPNGILKAAQTDAGLALPRDMKVTFIKE